MLFPEARRAVVAAAGERPVHDPGFDIDAARAEAQRAALAEPREDVAQVTDLDADGVPCRLYVPEDAVPGVIVHLHGGGFVLNDIEVHDAPARRLANRAGTAVLSVDYRRPPEHRFPAAPDDVDTVLAWVAREGGALGVEGPTYAHGDSAGANLALVAALRQPGRFDAVVLIYPFLDPSQGFDSYVTSADGFDPREAAWYWKQYAASADDLTDPDLAPLHSDRLGTLPPTLVVTAEHDPLRDEGEHLARLLAEQGVEVSASRVLGQVHGFWRHDRVFPAAEQLTRQVAGFLAGVRSRRSAG
ncbi:lipase [Nocardioides psychrotolerans]|uniref:Acetyl esterase n=1 Tax=Nocardioides psychrotolerans TaxID=1005945 RepID=A0A1I3CGD7_9ACTN|nr:alpha/beta hydrolase [Nocardioides psychrotolerans]GEP40256.1 lipase [Nocardioides psychrotolerans]SFH73588.1 acetyl esterase [Nocardioides psychrotolerans]